LIITYLYIICTIISLKLPTCQSWYIENPKLFPSSIDNNYHIDFKWFLKTTIILNWKRNNQYLSPHRKSINPEVVPYIGSIYFYIISICIFIMNTPSVWTPFIFFLLLFQFHFNLDYFDSIYSLFFLLSKPNKVYFYISGLKYHQKTRI